MLFRASLAAILVAAACSPVAPKTTGVPSSSTPQPGLTVKQVHDDFLTPGSDALFAAESDAAANPQLWTAAEAGATRLVSGAEQLQTGSRLKDSGRWLQISQAVAASARKSFDAVKRKDPDALAAADGEFTAQCEDCHNLYRDKGHGMMSDPSK